MTEEIIIDGVDVRFCQYFNSKNKKCRTCSYVEGIKYTSYKCEDDRRCYYKQLKRLEQENKVLNFKINQLKANGLYNDLTGIEFSAKVVELEQENKDLKKQIESDKGLITVGGKQQYQYLQRIDELEQENKKLKKDVQLFKCLDTFGESECHCACRCLGNEFCEDADKKINTYRSALEEINILAKNYCNACDEFKAKTYKNKNDCLYCNYGFIKRKINEVLQ